MMTDEEAQKNMKHTARVILAIQVEGLQRNLADIMTSLVSANDRSDERVKWMINDLEANHLQAIRKAAESL